MFRSLRRKQQRERMGRATARRVSSRMDSETGTARLGTRIAGAEQCSSGVADGGVRLWSAACRCGTPDQRGKRTTLAWSGRTAARRRAECSSRRPSTAGGAAVLDVGTPVPLVSSPWKRVARQRNCPRFRPRRRTAHPRRATERQTCCVRATMAPESFRARRMRRSVAPTTSRRSRSGSEPPRASSR